MSELIKCLSEISNENRLQFLITNIEVCLIDEGLGFMVCHVRGGSSYVVKSVIYMEMGYGVDIDHLVNRLMEMRDLLKKCVEKGE